MKPVRIGLIGDRNDAVPAHTAIPRVLSEIAMRAKLVVQPEWLETKSLAELNAQQLEAALSRLHGLWCVPNCPYASMDAALRSIQFAREHDVAFLGTCGGFQHAVIEYARNVMGIADADHAECNPTARNAVITPLFCSLVGHVGPIRFVEGSAVARHYGRLTATERYHCNYGLSAGFRDELNAGGMHISGVDGAGEPRIVELPDHRFFIGTLFQPERSSTQLDPHPLIAAFVQSAASLLSRHAVRLPEAKPHSENLDSTARID